MLVLRIGWSLSAFTLTIRSSLFQHSLKTASGVEERNYVVKSMSFKGNS